MVLCFLIVSVSELRGFLGKNHAKSLCLLLIESPCARVTSPPPCLLHHPATSSRCVSDDIYSDLAYLENLRPPVSP